MIFTNQASPSIRVLIAGLLLFLMGCGGGGSTSSGVGASVGSPFAGVYSGNRALMMSPGMQNRGNMFSNTFEISNMGQLIGGLNFESTGGVNCSDGPLVDIQANGQFASNFMVTCDGVGFDDCEVMRSVSGMIAGNTLSAATESTFNCANGTFTTQSTFNGIR